MRIDLYLVEKGLARSRSEAQRLIKSGAVALSGSICDRTSHQVEDGCDVQVDRSLCRYVSRGGLKLEAALEGFRVPVDGRVALDIGASSGGFTDCLLQHGAVAVYALENGRGQLHESLLRDKRVTSIEERNARYMKKADFPQPIEVVTMDVSFISQTLILPSVAAVLVEGGSLVSLIKPQFEVGKAQVGGGGIVRNARAREEAVKRVVDTATQCGFRLQGVMESPILGGDGNVEYLAHFVK